MAGARSWYITEDFDKDWNSLYSYVMVWISSFWCSRQVLEADILLLYILDIGRAYTAMLWYG